MSQNLPENMKVLRLFGVEQEAVTTLLQRAKRSDNVQLQSMEQNGETLILIEAFARSSSATAIILQGWEQQAQELCRDGVYGHGDVTLGEVMVQTFEKKNLLLACVDEQTGKRMEQKLATIPSLDKIYDFGAHSYANPKIAHKIAQGSSFAKKYPNETAQQVAGQLKVAYQQSGADYVLSIVPFEDDSHLVMIGEKTHYTLRRVKAGEHVVLWALDMLRRIATGAKPSIGTICVAYGAKLPSMAALADSNALNQEDFHITQQDLEAPEPPIADAKAGVNIFLAVVLMLLFALAGLVVLYTYTGGDITSLWHDSGLDRFQVSSATLLSLLSRFPIR